MKVRHIGIVVFDMDKMIDFYKGKVIYDETEKVRIVKIQMENTVIELLQFETMSENILRSRGISHIAFEPDPEGNMLEMVEIQKRKPFHSSVI